MKKKKTTIIEQCFTKILTSNSDMTDKLLEIYRLFNLNSTEINMIRIAEPKEEYFIKGNRRDYFRIESETEKGNLLEKMILEKNNVQRGCKQ